MGRQICLSGSLVMSTHVLGILYNYTVYFTGSVLFLFLAYPCLSDVA